MINLSHPLNSLTKGHWFKLICGASFQHLPSVRNLALAYTLAGADCIDVAADPAVISAAAEALQSAEQLASAAAERGFGYRGRPLLMVSLNDGEDPHFRKAEFNPAACPPDCSRPCERICPAQAIAFATDADAPEKKFSGVIDGLCYGCGRCLPVCPIGQIVTRSYVSAPAAVVPSVLDAGAQAIEIHTQVGRKEDFQRLWAAIAPAAGSLKLLAISCPDGEGLADYLWWLWELISPLPCPLIWQTDGRPMSGDIGGGTTRAAIKLGQKVLAARLPGYVQLAGGTNDSTAGKLRAAGLLQPQEVKGMKDESGGVLGGAPRGAPAPNTAQPHIAGVAYGSYARVLLKPVLDELEAGNPFPNLGASGSIPRLARLEDNCRLLWEAVNLADSLVSQLKFPLKFTETAMKK
ncbi:circadian clock protein LdpA [Kamptonema formosum]|uniref:circadian clock protein LdpA n=1 Tax=Kamptonema formosum TaxID=331992 RepID=UPI000348C679|nr:LdpA C-terminal domain-containing domain [Oscillatoria sp. PCC 10802]